MTETDEANLFRVFSNRGVVLCEDDDTLTSVRYLCNLAFSDVIDPTKNSKFPGTLVVSLNRTSLPGLKGQSNCHLPYKATDILPWIQPVDRQTPPTIHISHNTVVYHPPKRISYLKTNKDFNTLKMDFGFDDLFSFLSPLSVCYQNVDFGDSDGLLII